jgi:LAO/AO transport system kinase
MTELVERAFEGDRRALARLLSLVESGGPLARQALVELFPHTGQAHIVGMTGAPGVGKSSLVSVLAKVYRQRGRKVGIIAVDPTSPFTGGAILGDRIRMQDLSGDPGVFIRSMATRGSLGGLAWATRDAIKVLDAAGYQLILVETVGAGQSEVDIAAAADTTVVVTVPGLGDDVQAIKAGILEIADVFAVNKADLPGADQVTAALRMMLNLGASRPHQVWHHRTRMDMPALGASRDEPGWTPSICKTVALRGDGVAELADAIEHHREYLAETGLRQVRERARIRADFLDLLRHELLDRLLERVASEQVESLIDRVMARELDPYTAAGMVLGEDVKREM